MDPLKDLGEERKTIMKYIRNRMVCGCVVGSSGWG
jgi:hypothetical protein